MTTPFVTLSAVKASLSISPASTKWDAQLSSYIAVASESIEKHLNREFDYRARADTFDTVNVVGTTLDLYGNGNECGIVFTARRQRFVLTGIPIDTTQPFTISYDPSRGFDSTTVVDPANYVVDYDLGVVTLHYGTGRTMKGLQVQYTGGYRADPTTGVLTGTSGRLQLACIIQVGWLRTKLNPENIGMESDRTKSATTRMNMVQKFIAHQGITPEAAMLLADLRPIAMGRY